jgi:hypothetical protein
LSSEEVKTKPTKPTIHYNTSKPTCTLNLVCYRSGSKGCELHQIQTAKRSRFKSEAEFQRMVEETTGLIITDEQFFRALRKVYLGKMCGFWRRVFFLKTLRGIRLLSVSTCTTRMPFARFPNAVNINAAHIDLVHTHKPTNSCPTRRFRLAGSIVRIP